MPALWRHRVGRRLKKPRVLHPCSLMLNWKHGLGMDSPMASLGAGRTEVIDILHTTVFVRLALHLLKKAIGGDGRASSVFHRLQTPTSSNTSIVFINTLYAGNYRTATLYNTIRAGSYLTFMYRSSQTRLLNRASACVPDFLPIWSSCAKQNRCHTYVFNYETNMSRKACLVQEMTWR
jgi:hypothetical protein